MWNGELKVIMISVCIILILGSCACDCRNKHQNELVKCNQLYNDYSIDDNKLLINCTIESEKRYEACSSL